MPGSDLAVLAGPDIMYALVLEDGRRWGEVAADFQVEDVEEIFSPERPNWHFLTRGRGGSKTSDIAGVALSWLYADAPPRARGYVVASNSEQAAILIDAAAGFVARTPVLEDRIEVENERIINRDSGAWVRVLSLSDSGSWGLRDTHLLICDEFAQWPETRGAKRVYTAIRSTVQKTPGCRLILLTSAGEPSHWSFQQVFRKALSDKDNWRVHEVPGPVPWQSPEDLAALQRELRPSEYERLVLNRWTEDEDRAISEEDYDLAAQPADVRTDGVKTTARLSYPKPGVKYVIAVDIGILNDATVMCVAHKEPLDPNEPYGPHRAVVDYLERWQGSKKRPVQVSEVEDWLVAEAPKWNRAEVYADPTQFRGNVQNLNRRGVKASEWNFTATSVGEVATALVSTFRTRQIHVPDSKVLKEELLRVRLRESAPGVTRLDHDRTGHDDQAVTIGMACHILLGKTMWGQGAAFMEAFKREKQNPPKEPRRRNLLAHEEAPRARRCTIPRLSLADGRCWTCGVPNDEHQRTS